jgi:hypothetical protein
MIGKFLLKLLIKHCNSCRKRWTSDCPIRVWGRNEKNHSLKFDVEMNYDYCSRYCKGEEVVIKN